MIIIRFTSGLGNQMYQYSFYQLMKKTYPDTEVKVDLTWFYANNDHHGYELQRIFGQDENCTFYVEEASSKEIFKATGLIPNKKQPNDMITELNGDKAHKGKYTLEQSKKYEEFRRYPNRILREFTGRRHAPYFIDQLSGNISNLDYVNDDGKTVNDIYDKVMNLDTSKDWYLIGFWIEERFAGQVLDITRDHFKFPALKDDKNAFLGRVMATTESVSIHVRRGDYLTTYANMFKPLTMEYYKSAISYIGNYVRSMGSNPIYYIFSDDAEYVREVFSWLPNKTIVANNTGNDSYVDMQLMSLCKYNIIANSTFSQWAALLNTSEDNIVIYPKDYLIDQDNEVKSFKNWIMM